MFFFRTNSCPAPVAGYRPEEYAYDKAREVRKLLQSTQEDLCEADRNKKPASARICWCVKIDFPREITKFPTQLDGYLFRVEISKTSAGKTVNPTWFNLPENAKVFIDLFHTEQMQCTFAILNKAPAALGRIRGDSDRSSRLSDVVTSFIL